MLLNELMLGDWYTWYADGKLYPFKIDNRVYTIDDEYSVMNFEGILLDDVIMKGNKFMEYNDGLDNLYYCIDSRYNVYLWKGGYIYYKETSGNIVELFECRYVHHLQHFLRMIKSSHIIYITESMVNK
jgi:hypothetical protein